ncbi:MAG TPA: T9SS type A sorting domain-containing protein, partial [Panacibacter sp.]|nr:T9SS type A sorting domain-containing protein [Panacibacter sp.]
KIWYRLKIIDKDGSYTYSKTVPVTISSYAGTLKVYPNPAKDQVFVLFKMQNTGKAALRITDISGKIVYSNIVHENQDTGIAGVNISALNKGMYYVLIITGNDTQRTQFLKQ